MLSNIEAKHLYIDHRSLVTKDSVEIPTSKKEKQLDGFCKTGPLSDGTPCIYQVTHHWCYTSFIRNVASLLLNLPKA
jgi:hypothetical protein